MENIDKNKVASLLLDIPIFAEVSEDARLNIVDIMKLNRYHPDTMIIEQGSKGEEMYIIKSGAVRVTRLDDESEDEIFIATLKEGDYFGELSLIDNMPRSANVTTAGECEVLKLTKKDFDVFLDKNHEAAKLFYRNCLMGTITRHRNIISRYTFTSHDLKNKASELDEINRDLSFAQKIQNYMINRDYLDKVDLGDIKHSYVYNPCIAIGGDFINLVKLDEENIGLIIADVTGHGITAALVTGVLKSAFLLLMKEHGKTPAKLLELLSNHMNEVINRLFATSYYAVINIKTGLMKMSNAGHHQPLVYKAKNGRIEDIECKGPGLGMLPEPVFNNADITLEKGDKILFYTDGIIEQIDCDHNMFGKKRLVSSYLEYASKGESDIAGKLMKDLKDFSGDVPMQDDVTLILFEL